MVMALWISIVAGVATLACLIAWAVTGMKNRTLQRIAGVLMLVTIAAYFAPRLL